MLFPNPRLIFLLIFLACSTLLASAIFMEPFKSMNPCPMCMMQRALFIGVGVVALMAVIHGAKRIGENIYSTIIGLISLGGASVAIRQLWLQSLPEDQVPACGPGIDYMLEVFPILEVIEMSLRGTGDCAKVQWTLLNISIPGWSLLAFSGFVILAITVLFNKRVK